MDYKSSSLRLAFSSSEARVDIGEQVSFCLVYYFGYGVWIQRVVEDSLGRAGLK
jgi:hypothetical protein